MAHLQGIGVVVHHRVACWDVHTGPDGHDEVVVYGQMHVGETIVSHQRGVHVHPSQTQPHAPCPSYLFKMKTLQINNMVPNFPDNSVRSRVIDQ